MILDGTNGLLVLTPTGHLLPSSMWVVRGGKAPGRCELCVRIGHVPGVQGIGERN